MPKFSLSEREAFSVEGCGCEHYGSNQEWYSERIRRFAGCAPSVAACILRYLLRDECENKCPTKDEMLSLMDEAWAYITPGDMGMPSAVVFAELFLSYLKSKGLSSARAAVCDLHSSLQVRPAFSEVADFIETALKKDLPVAFLNLDSGKEQRLETWHWVTITALDREGESATAEFIDGGKLMSADLALWYRTTERGGGFVAVSLR